jgi:dTDP-4-amino-4,6-dideoxygalactose transaminase
MNIHYLDLQAQNLSLQTELMQAMQAVLQSGQYIGGSFVEQFETEFAQYTGAAHCVGCGNGLDALRLSLMALGIGAGDEVIVPSHTYIATWLPVTHLGATLVPAEPDMGSFHLAAHNIAPHITAKTKAIIVVHLYDMPCDMDAICALANQHSIPVIEDAAQAHGAKLRGRAIGSHGDLVAWSFYPGKNLGALGDAGAITTNNAQLAQKIRALGNYGSTRKYYNDYLGINSRLDPLQAALLSVKLRHLDSWNAHRQRIAQHYQQALAGHPAITLPPCPADTQSAWHCFTIRSSQRDALQEHLAQHGVQTLIHYPLAPHQQRAYAASPVAKLDLPVAEGYANTVLSLPIDPLLNLVQTQNVCQHITQFLSHARA